MQYGCCQATGPTNKHTHAKELSGCRGVTPGLKGEKGRGDSMCPPAVVIACKRVTHTQKKKQNHLSDSFYD